jgi:hypothetical protein
LLPIDQDDEVDLYSDEFAEIPADRRISRVTKSKVSEMAAEGGGEITRMLAVVFELSESCSALSAAALEMST